MITERKKTHTQVHNDVKRILLVGWYFLFYSFHLFFVSQENVTPSLWLTFLFLEKCDRFNRLYKSALNLRRDLDGWPAHAAFIERQEKKRTKQNKTKQKLKTRMTRPEEKRLPKESATTFYWENVFSLRFRYGSIGLMVWFLSIRKKDQPVSIVEKQASTKQQLTIKEE